MQVYGKKICTKSFGGVEAEKVIIVFEILNNSNIWLFPHYRGRVFSLTKGTPPRECDPYCIPKVTSAGMWQVKLHQIIWGSNG